MRKVSSAISVELYKVPWNGLGGIVVGSSGVFFLGRIVVKACWLFPMNPVEVSGKAPVYSRWDYLDGNFWRVFGVSCIGMSGKPLKCSRWNCRESTCYLLGRGVRKVSRFLSFKSSSRHLGVLSGLSGKPLGYSRLNGLGNVFENLGRISMISLICFRSILSTELVSYFQPSKPSGVVCRKARNSYGRSGSICLESLCGTLSVEFLSSLSECAEGLLGVLGRIVVEDCGGVLGRTVRETSRVFSVELSRYLLGGLSVELSGERLGCSRSNCSKSLWILLGQTVFEAFWYSL